jgi:hypothetical protein
MFTKIVLFCIFSFLLLASSLWAAGIGIYGTGGVNFSNWESNGSTPKSTAYFYGGGLVIDSNAARNELFGYRFTAGYEQVRRIYPYPNFLNVSIHKFSMTHTLGFGVVRNENLRLWIGPQLGLHYLYYPKKTFITSGYKVNLSLAPTKFVIQIDVIGFDALLALGLNINIGETATIFLEIGVGYMGGYDIDFKGTANAFGIDGKIGFMFRVKDTYTAANNIKTRVD